MRVKSLWVLVRFIPVLSWSFSAIFLGVSIVIADQSWVGVKYGHLALVFISATLLQGVIAHAYNDIKDWQTGTDQKSPGVLSGGSRVIPRLLFDSHELSRVAIFGIVGVIAIAIYFMVVIDVAVVIFLLVGLWAAIAYSCAPFNLAYRPWLGEWLCAWPAMVTCTVGTSYVLSGGHWYWKSLFLGMLHATFSITWLMMHHIPDVDADISATPPKWTTVAYHKVREGWGGVAKLIDIYLFLAIGLAFYSGLLFQELAVFLIPLLCGIGIFYMTGRTNFDTVESVTRLEICAIFLTILNAIGISWLLDT